MSVAAAAVTCGITKLVPSGRRYSSGPTARIALLGAVRVLRRELERERREDVLARCRDVVELGVAV